MPFARHRSVQIATRHQRFLLAIMVLQLLSSGHFTLASAVTVCPPGSIPPCTYPTITEAIAVLGAGVTIEVKPGRYPERVEVKNLSGTAQSPMIIRAAGAPGTVIVDGSDDYSTQTWTNVSGTNVWWAANSTMAPPSTQVWVNNRRYANQPTKAFADLLVEEYRYDAFNDKIYVNVGGGNPNTKQIYLGHSNRDEGFYVENCDFLTIDGFTVLRVGDEGIEVTGASGTDLSTGVTVKNCTSARNWGQGIYFNWTTNGSILSNTTYLNNSHGIHLTLSEYGNIARNHSYSNDEVDDPRGGKCGIEIGGTSDSANCFIATVDYNNCHDNEDSGIEVRGARRVLVRRNVSYRNGDHGYDTNYAKHTTYLNNVAVRNAHDGISIEPFAYYNTVYSCITANNAQNPSTLAAGSGKVRELYIGNTTGFASDYNILLVSTPTGPITSGHRYTAEYGTNPPYETLDQYKANTMNLDDNSHASAPYFADSADGDFKVNSPSSDAVDKGKSDVTGWLSTDPLGVAPYDVSGASGGTGTPNYSDRGAFEYIPGGGCPFVDTRTASGWKVENSVLARSPSGALETDTYRLKETPAVVEGRYQVRLRENEREITTFDHVSLVSVDHPVGTKVYPLKGRFVLAQREAPYRAVTGTGRDVTHLVNGSGADFFTGQRGETLYVDLIEPGRVVAPVPPDLDPFEMDDGEKYEEAVQTAELEGTAAALDAQVLSTSGILIQGKNTLGQWETVRRRYPREHFDAALIDTLDEGLVRLVFVGRHKLRFVGRVVPSSVASAQTHRLVRAQHTRLGDARTAVNTGDDQTVLLMPGDTLNLEFSATAVPEGQVRDLFLVSRGVYTSQPLGPESKAAIELPEKFALLQNRPNPFARTTLIGFELPRAERVKIEIFDPQGRRVRTAADQLYQPGRWSVEWDGRDEAGTVLPATIYFYRMTAGSFRTHKKLVMHP